MVMWRREKGEGRKALLDIFFLYPFSHFYFLDDDDDDYQK
jgi:hypothetical protein